MTVRSLLALVLAAALLPVAAARAELPPIGHVFVIVLEDKDYDATFGASPGSRYLGRSLVAKGELLTHYYGIGHGSLANYIAMVSGQAPNPVTQSDCPVFQDFFPGNIQGDQQATGNGCVYPVAANTVADQLTARGLVWGGYMEDMGNSATQPKTCRHPALNAGDDTQNARPGDAYATRHNPFAYFHSLIDYPACAAHDVPLDRLPAALRSGNVPALVFITPNLCSDGHDASCPDGRPGGYAGIDAFLGKWVPRIQSSRAFRDGGLLVVTFDESASGAEGCCVEDAPNTTNAGGPIPGPGGGRVGAVLLSPYIKAGSVNDTAYNHYSLLRSIEELFALRPLGFAAEATGFGDDVYNGPRCFSRPLPAGAGKRLPAGTLIASLAGGGRSLTIRMAHAADVSVRARRGDRSRRVLHRRLAACAAVSARLPSGTRLVTVTAVVHRHLERRTLRIA